jgi:hypothetical protein
MMDIPGFDYDGSFNRMLEYQLKCFKRMMVLREERGYKPRPSNPVVSKMIREMPNLYLKREPE